MAGGAAVAASGQWWGAEGVRLPAGEVHAWHPGTNQTLCGVPLARAGLRRFPHVRWDYRGSDELTATDQVGYICPKCLAATQPRRSQRRPWTRHTPRP
ncbi:MAG TPA: hypothetical protein VK453_09455 [Micromonosporaceae bacterium]|nr:hypothetical protein [Micromonosporaceae bacterium]